MGQKINYFDVFDNLDKNHKKIYLLQRNRQNPQRKGM